MQVKIVSTKEGKKSSTIYPCTHVSVLETESITQVTLMGGPLHGLVINLPEDGDRIFMMNDGGDTTDSYVAPGKEVAR